MLFSLSAIVSLLISFEIISLSIFRFLLLLLSSIVPLPISFAIVSLPISFAIVSLPISFAIVSLPILLKLFHSLQYDIN